MNVLNNPGTNICYHANDNFAIYSNPFANLVGNTTGNFVNGSASTTLIISNPGIYSLILSSPGSISAASQLINVTSNSVASILLQVDSQDISANFKFRVYANLFDSYGRTSRELANLYLISNHPLEGTTNVTIQDGGYGFRVWTKYIGPLFITAVSGSVSTNISVMILPNELRIYSILPRVMIIQTITTVESFSLAVGVYDNFGKVLEVDNGPHAVNVSIVYVTDKQIVYEKSVLSVSGISNFIDIQLIDPGLYFLSVFADNMLTTPSYAIGVSRPKSMKLVMVSDLSLIYTKHLYTLCVYLYDDDVNNPIDKEIIEFYAGGQLIGYNETIDGYASFSLVFNSSGRIRLSFSRKTHSDVFETNVLESDNKDLFCIQAYTDKICEVCIENFEILEGKCFKTHNQSSSKYLLGFGSILLLVISLLAGKWLYQRSFGKHNLKNSTKFLRDNKNNECELEFI